MRDHSSSVLKIQVLFHPWFYFGIFLVSNTFLSYVPLSFSMKLWIGLLGLFLPCVFALWTILEKRVKKRELPSPSEKTPVIDAFSDTGAPIWLWFLFFLLLIFTRFYKLTSLPFWFNGDEGTFCVIAMELQRHWSWKLLLGENQWEPLFSWLLVLFFKVLPPSILSFRLFTSLLSIATIAASYWAVRPLGSRRFAIFTIWALAFSFWPFSLSRICIMHGLFVLWEIIALGFLLRISKSEKYDTQSFIFLGLMLGSGFYIFTTWPLVVLIIGGYIALEIILNRSMSEAWRPSIFLIFTTVFLALPMVMARLSGGGFVSHPTRVFE